MSLSNRIEAFNEAGGAISTKLIRSWVSEVAALEAENRELKDGSIIPTGIQRRDRLIDELRAEVERLKGGVTVKPRKVLMRFFQLMERKLKKNEHKSHWHHHGCKFLQEEMGRNYQAIIYAIADEDKEQVISKAVNIANFAMMIADNAEANYAAAGEGG